MKPYEYSGANITYLTLASNSEDNHYGNEAERPSLYEELVNDALQILTNSLHESLLASFPTNLSCQKSQSWFEGSRLINLMREVSQRDFSIFIKLGMISSPPKSFDEQKGISYRSSFTSCHIKLIEDATLLLESGKSRRIWSCDIDMRGCVKMC